MNKNIFSQIQGLKLTGDPKSSTGASWTYRDSSKGIWYDLEGILFEPNTGNTNYPAVIINHGTSGNVNGYSKSVAKKMVQWGFVCIATNLCHSGGVPIGSPGDTSLANFGASTNNYLRDMKCWDILASLHYVDTNCIMSFGHSRGAYTTTGLVASYPTKFRCAGHTAGGAINQSGYSAPSTALASKIKCPYIMHHGTDDMTVPIMFDSLLNNTLNQSGIEHQFYIYPGLDHPEMSMDSLMFQRTMNWFVDHSCITTSNNEESKFNNFQVKLYPNPVQTDLVIESKSLNCELKIIDINGTIIYTDSILSDLQQKINCLNFPNGIYFLNIVFDNKFSFNRMFVVLK